jgi:hypothetical protein
VVVLLLEWMLCYAGVLWLWQQLASTVAPALVGIRQEVEAPTSRGSVPRRDAKSDSRSLIPVLTFQYHVIVHCFKRLALYSMPVKHLYLAGG